MHCEEVLQDLYDILEPYKGVNIGHDDFVYGYYIEWQKLNDLPVEKIEMLCDYFGIEFNGKFDEVYEKLRELGVPEETAHEPSPEFPEKEGYWYEPYDDYIDRESYVDEILRIKNLVAENEDELIKKSLILSALIFTESFVSFKIVEKIRSLNKGVDDLLICLINNSIIKNLWRREVRCNTCKLLFGNEKLGEIPCDDIRDSLAHNIRVARILDDKIIYIGKNKTSKDKDINSIFTALKDFAQQLEHID